MEWFSVFVLDLHAASRSSRATGARNPTNTGMTSLSNNKNVIMIEFGAQVRFSFVLYEQHGCVALAPSPAAQTWFVVGRATRHRNESAPRPPQSSRPAAKVQEVSEKRTQNTCG